MFYKFNYIKKICLISDKVDFVQEVLKKNFSELEKFVVVKGGASRHISIKNGLTQLSKYGRIFKVVVIHDGVRPFISEEFICKIISQGALYGAAGATRPLVSTIIKPNEEGFVESCLIRNEYIQSETPQAFLYDIILNAYEKCNEYDLMNGTECLQLALKYSQVKAKLIPGPDSLWKVTDKKDLYSLVSYIKEKSTYVCLVRKKENQLVTTLFDLLKNKVNQVDYFSPGINLNPTKYFYNNVVYFSTEQVKENHLTLLKTLFDNNPPNLLIYVIEQTNSDSKDSLPIIERSKTEKILKMLYEALKKEIILIYFLNLEKEKQLIDLILSLIFLDIQTLSGQVLFV